MKRKLTDAEESNLPKKKKAKTDHQQTPIDNSTITVEKVMPEGNKYAGKKISFVLKSEAKAIPHHMMYLEGYDDKKLEGNKLATQQREHIRNIINMGTLEDFNKKFELLNKYFIDHRKIFKTWEAMIGIETCAYTHDQISEDDKNIIFWIVRNKRFEMLDTIIKYSIKLRTVTKEHKDYDRDDFMGSILANLFKSYLPLTTLIELLNYYYPGKKAHQPDYKKIIKKMRVAMIERLDQDSYKHGRFKEIAEDKNANLIEDLLISTSRDDYPEQCFHYFDKIKWLAENGEPIQPGLIHRLIDETLKDRGHRGRIKSIFKFYNDDMCKLFNWLLEQDKEHAGLYDKAYQNNTEHLRLLIENGIGPKEWTLNLSASLGVFDKYKELIQQAIERNNAFIRETSQGQNLLYTALQSTGYADSLSYFKTIHFMVMQNSDFIKNGDPIISFHLLGKIGSLAEDLIRECSNSAIMSDDKRSASSNSKEEKNSFSTDTYWQMMHDLFLQAFNVLHVKADSFNQLLNINKGSLGPIITGLKSILKVEIKHQNKIQHSPTLLHAFVKMLKQKRDFAAVQHHHWIGSLVDGLDNIELAKIILIELGKEDLDLAEAVINTVKFPDLSQLPQYRRRLIFEADEMLQNLKNLLKEPIIKEHIKSKQALSLGMHLVFRGIQIEVKNILNILHELGGDFLWKPTPEELKIFPSISQGVSPRTTLLLEHIDGFVSYKRNLGFKNVNEKKRLNKLYDEKKAFSITTFLLEKKIDHTIEFDFNYKGYRFKGNLFDYITMINRVEALSAENGYLAFHEQEFFRHEIYREAMQAARDRTDTRMLRGPDEQKQGQLRRPLPLQFAAMEQGLAQQHRQALVQAREVWEALGIIQPMQMQPARFFQLQQRAANGVPQAMQQAAPARAPAKRPQPQLLRTHEDKQNTHGAAVHELTANAALKLKKAYLPVEGETLQSLLRTTYRTIYMYYAQQVQVDLEIALNKTHPPEKYTDQVFRKAQIDADITAVKNHIILAKFDSAKQFFYQPNHFVPELWSLKSFIAFRWVRVTFSHPTVCNWIEPTTKVTLTECLCSVWLALNDSKHCSNDREAMLRLLTDRFVDIQQEYPDLGQNEQKVFSPACASGAFNQLISTLEGQHPDVPIINRIRVGHLFDYVAGYYEEKFNQLDLQKKHHYFKELLDKRDYNPDALLPEQFINDFEKGFYEKHQPDVDKKYITLHDIKNLFHNEYVPWVIGRFRLMSDFIKQEIANRTSVSQSSSSYQQQAAQAPMEFTPQIPLLPPVPGMAEPAPPPQAFQPHAAGGNLMLNIQGNNNQLLLALPNPGQNPFAFFNPPQQPQQQPLIQAGQGQPAPANPPQPEQDKGDRMQI